MIKKILIAVLALSIAFVFLCTPVTADEVEVREPYIDLTEYFGLRGALTLHTMSASNANGIFSNGSFIKWGDVIGSLSVHSVEFVFSYTGDMIPSLTRFSLCPHYSNISNVLSLSPIVSYPMDGIIRVRADTDGFRAQRIDWLFNNVDSSTDITLLSARVFLSDTYSTTVSGSLNTPAGSSSIAADGGGYSSFDIGSSSGIVTTTIRIGVDDWRNYDVISLSGYLSCTSIVSVNAVLLDNTSLRDIVIPFDHNYFGEYSGQSAIYQYSLRADLTGINHVTQPDSTLWFYITCNLASSTTGVIYVDSIVASINANFDISGIYDSFSTLSLNALRTYVNYIRNSADSIDKNLEEFLPAILAAISNIGVTEEDVADAQNKADSAQSSADSLNGLGQSIHSGTPSIDTNMQITPGVIPSDGSDGLVTNLFDLFWGNSMILSMITTVAAIATISYVFFGKKG